MARRRDFSGGYESCSHWSNLEYARKDSTRYPRQVGEPWGRQKHLHPACVQRWHAYEDVSVMVLWYLSRNCKLPLVEIQSKHDHLVEFRRGPRHSGCATPWQPPSAGPAIFLHDGAMHAADCENQGPASPNDNQTFLTPSSVMWWI